VVKAGHALGLGHPGPQLQSAIGQVRRFPEGHRPLGGQRGGDGAAQRGGWSPAAA